MWNKRGVSTYHDAMAVPRRPMLKELTGADVAGTVREYQKVTQPRAGQEHRLRGNPQQ
jgi:hypothetical protein